MSTIEQESAINKILEELINSKKELTTELSSIKTELLSAIEASETRLLLRLEETTNKVKQLQKENNDLKNKLNTLDKQCRKNNLVIFGLQKPRELTVGVICQKLNSLLETTLDANDFNDVYSLGHSTRNPVKIELVSYQNKRLIFQNCKKLKGTGIVITNDLTEIQRGEGKLLRKFLQKARQENSEKSYIKGNILYVGNQKYTLKDLAQLEEKDKEESSNSAPSTPTRLVTPKGAVSEVFDNIEKILPTKELSTVTPNRPVNISVTRFKVKNKPTIVTRSKFNK